MDSHSSRAVSDKPRSPRPDLSLTFGALSDPSRREMLRLLRRGEMRVTEIAAPFALSLNAVSKHVRALERAGLVRRRVSGRDHYIGLAAAPLHEAAGWLAEYGEFWESRIDALEALLTTERQSESNDPGPRATTPRHGHRPHR